MKEADQTLVTMDPVISSRGITMKQTIISIMVKVHMSKKTILRCSKLRPSQLVSASV